MCSEMCIEGTMMMKIHYYSKFPHLRLTCRCTNTHAHSSHSSTIMMAIESLPHEGNEFNIIWANEMPLLGTHAYIYIYIWYKIYGVFSESNVSAIATSILTLNDCGSYFME